MWTLSARYRFCMPNSWCKTLKIVSNINMMVAVTHLSPHSTMLSLMSCSGSNWAKSPTVIITWPFCWGGYDRMLYTNCSTESIDWKKMLTAGRATLIASQSGLILSRHVRIRLNANMVDILMTLHASVCDNFSDADNKCSIVSPFPLSMRRIKLEYDLRLEASQVRRIILSCLRKTKPRNMFKK